MQRKVMKVSWYAMVVLSALVAPSFTQTLSADEAKPKVHHKVIVESGEVTPENGTFLPFSFFNASLNSRDEVAFDAVVTGPPPTTAIFLRERKRISAIALGTNPDKSEPSFGTVTNSFLTEGGDVVFHGNVGEVFRSNGKKAIPLVQPGEPVQGGGTVTALLSQPAVNERGAIAYDASVSGAGSTQGATQAVLRGDGMRTISIASDAIAPPTGGTFVSFQDLSLNVHGEVAFKADTAGGSADHGIFRGDGGRVTPVLVTNQIVPGGEIIDDCGPPEINAHGQVASLCRLINGNAINGGIFTGHGGDIVTIALGGQPSPTGATYGILLSFELNDRDEAAFLARLSDGKSGLFRGNGKHTTTIALSGTTAPGTTGTFQSFGDAFKLGDDGRVLFTADLVPGIDGVDSTNNVGIWVGTAEGDLTLVARTGDVINGKAVTSLPFTDNVGRPLDLNGNRVMWRGTFGAMKALVLSRIAGDNDRGNEEN
jgi:hypothetical protein